MGRLYLAQSRQGLQKAYSHQGNRAKHFALLPSGASSTSHVAASGWGCAFTMNKPCLTVLGVLGLAEEGVEVGEHGGGVPLLEADEFAGDFAVAIDDVGFRDHGRAVGHGDRGAIILGSGVAVGRESDSLVVEEFLEGRRICICGNTKDDTVARFDVLLQPVERGGFFDARRAPTGPEIEDHNLAAKIGEAGGFAGEVQRKIQSGLSGDGGFTLTIAWQGKNEDDACRQRERSPSCQFSSSSHQMLY
jgi:hypothetical protein